MLVEKRMCKVPVVFENQSSAMKHPTVNVYDSRGGANLKERSSYEQYMLK